MHPQGPNVHQFRQQHCNVKPRQTAQGAEPPSTRIQVVLSVAGMVEARRCSGEVKERMGP
eukprot:2628199-Alexandrium_andersonii.AAC.1